MSRNLHIMTASRQPIELEHLPTSFVFDQDLPIVHVAADTASPLVTDAARAFFAMGLQPELVETANRLTDLDEVGFATPNFVS